MRAVTYRAGAGLAQVEGEPDLPGPGQVAIDVAYVGLCGTDLHLVHGAMDHRIGDRHHVFGHEMSGTVADVGVDVADIARGDRVSVMPLRWDGTCPACRNGNSHVCQNLDFIGIDSPGALQQRWVVDADTVIRLPQELRLDHAALVEPTAVAVHDVHRGAVRHGEKVVVVGAGPIGSLIALVARRSGADVLVIEVDATRRRQVEELGFATLDPRGEDQVAAVERWTEGAGADVAFEVSGAAAAVLDITSLLRVRGRVVIVAIHVQARPVDLQRVFWRELTLHGARVYERSDFEEAANLIAEGAIPVDRLITDVLPLSQVAEGIGLLESGAAMKVLIDVRSENA
jgi:2-desacetyl-2-hydroxyethyl bacteriochlorophyllide A dehydrogenase